MNDTSSSRVSPYEGNISLFGVDVASFMKGDTGGSLLFLNV